MKPLTIKQLYDHLAEQIKNGHGDYTVFVTDDEEANGYHALWYFGDIATQLYDTREGVEATNHDLSVLKDKDKAIYIG